MKGEQPYYYIDELEAQGQTPKGPDLSAYAYGQIQNQNQENLVVFQLELDNILEKIEHLLRGDVVKDDGEGNITYQQPKKEIVAKIVQDNEATTFTIDINGMNIYSIENKNLKNEDSKKEIIIESGVSGQMLLQKSGLKLLGYKKVEVVDNNLIVMNDYGVQMIMALLSSYLNRNTILSNYKAERIYEILFVLGDELSDMIFCNYEKMGMDTQWKKSRYTFIVMNILHMVESAYFRALEGNELESLRSARVVTQNQPLGQQQQPSIPQRKRGFSLNPFRRWM